MEVMADIPGALQRMTSDVTLLHACLLLLELKRKSGMFNRCFDMLMQLLGKVNPLATLPPSWHMLTRLVFSHPHYKAGEVARACARLLRDLSSP